MGRRDIVKTLVAVKVVPVLGAVRFQPGLNRIVRQDVASMVNPSDMAALKAALVLRTRHGGDVVAVTMGPPEIDPILKELLALGTDRVIHLCDPRFAGADTLATARALSQVFEREGADVLLCGRSTVDGGTAQTPAQVAELAGVSYVASAVGLRVDGDTFHVVAEDEEGSCTCSVRLPAVVSVEPGCAVGDDETVPPAGGGGVERWDADALGGDDAGYGIRGSRTYVQEVVETTVVRKATVVDCQEAIDIIDRGRRPDRPVMSAGAARSLEQTPARSALWVVVEHHDDRAHPASIEALACAAEVAGRLGADVVAVLLCDEPGSLPAALAARGADRVVVGAAPELHGQPADIMAAALAALLVEHTPLAVIAPWSRRGRQYLPQVAARAQLGLTGDFVGLDVAPHPVDRDAFDLVWLKPAWAGTALARVVARSVPALGTLRPGAVEPLPERDPDGVPVETIEIDRAALAELAGRRASEIVTSTAVHSVDTAPVVVCVGPLVPPDVVGLIEEEATQRGWGFAGTADAVSAGLVARQRELSIVKRSIAPPVFVGVELRSEHDLACVRAAGVIVAVGDVLEPALRSASDVIVETSAGDFVAALRDAGSRFGSGPQPAP